MLIKRLIFYDSDEIEIRLPFYRSFLTSWNMFSGLCTQDFFHRHTGEGGDLKSFVS